jgi:hypothetical protein
MSALNVTITDSFSLTDGTARLAPATAPIVSDTLVFSDLLQVAMILRLSVSDTLSFLDGIAPSINRGNSSSDSISLSDAVSAVLAIVLTKTTTDSFSLSDTVSVLLSDTFSSYIRRYLNDTV